MDPYTGRIGRQIRFLVEADKLKRVLRQSLITGNSRRENSAEHSWHISLMAVVLADQAAGTELDLLRVLKMLLLHDLVEIDAGDTFIYDEAAKRDQQQRERLAADRIFALLPPEQEPELRALWDEFEARESAEARFAVAVDRLQPLLLNYVNGGPGWRKHGVTARQVRAINAEIDRGSPALWRYAQELIADAERRGFLAP